MTLRLVEAIYFHTEAGRQAGLNPNSLQQKAKIAFEQILLNLHNTYRKRTTQWEHTEVLIWLSSWEIYRDSYFEASKINKTWEFYKLKVSEGTTLVLEVIKSIRSGKVDEIVVRINRASFHIFFEKFIFPRSVGLFRKPEKTCK